MQKEDFKSCDIFIDAGGGTGILSLAACKLGAKKVVMIDTAYEEYPPEYGTENSFLKETLETLNLNITADDYLLIGSNIKDIELIAEMMRHFLPDSSSNVILSSNIGVWSDYGGITNISSLILLEHLFKRFPVHILSILLGGYDLHERNSYLKKWEDSRHEYDFMVSHGLNPFVTVPDLDRNLVPWKGPYKKNEPDLEPVSYIPWYRDRAIIERVFNMTISNTFGMTLTSKPGVNVPYYIQQPYSFSFTQKQNHKSNTITQPPPGVIPYAA